MTENFPRIISDTNKPQIQEAQRIWLLHVMLLSIHSTIIVTFLFVCLFVFFNYSNFNNCRLTVGMIHSIPKTQNGYGSL